MEKKFTETKTAFYFDGTIADGVTESKKFTFLGNFLLSGIVTSNEEVTLRIEEGIEINAENYIKTTDIILNAGDIKSVEYVLYGAYAKISIINNSGSTATVVANLHYRHENIVYTRKNDLVKIDEDNTPIVNTDDYTSSWFDVSEYKDLSGMVKADQDGTFKVEYSDNQSTVLASDSSSYTANTTPGFTADKIGRYARFVFENNSGSDQGSFDYVLYGRI